MYLYYMSYVVPCTILFPLGVAGLRYTSIDIKLRLIFYYLLLSFFFNSVTTVLAESGQNNLPLFHLFTLLEGVILLFFYRESMADCLNRRLFRVIVCAYICFCIINSLFIQDLHSFNTYSRFAEALLIISFSLYYFYTTLEIKMPGQWYSDPLIMINIGLLIYFSSSLFLFLFSEVLLSNRQINILAWVIHATLVMIMYILFGIGFFNHRKLFLYSKVAGRRQLR
jgi:hypothetical protein